MTYCYSFLTSQFISDATGASLSSVRQWRTRGVPKRYQGALKDALIEMAESILIDCDKPRVTVVNEAPKRKRPSTSHWATVRDIVTEQMREEGLDCNELMATNIAHYGEAGAWKLYIKHGNYAERMAKHAAKEKPA